MSIQAGNITEWIEILDQMYEHSFHKVVPGHGPVGEKKDVLALRMYLSELLEQAQQINLKTSSAQQITNTPVPEPYLTWNVPSLYGRNLQHLLHQSPRKS
ncbi:hypothetical protein [Brevibacillus sp. NRS-1366]|uniref:hypothetical protein n=1 Tax=Brevibacillus sp. NRS-1366 TaxID=3233899 RepID=UPI003D1A3AB0